jgi:serralysin
MLAVLGHSGSVTNSSSGTIVASGVVGIEVFDLASSGADTLTLDNGNFFETGSTITVGGGNDGNTLGEAGVAAADKTILEGGSKTNTLIVGRNATMTGGAGSNLFEFTAPGILATPDTNIIANFGDGSDEIACNDAGLDLGLSGASPTPQALPAGLFVANAIGSFTTFAERLAYGTDLGQLYYDLQGNKAGSWRLIAATELFFVS